MYENLTYFNNVSLHMMQITFRVLVLHANTGFPIVLSTSTIQFVNYSEFEPKFCEAW